MKNRNCTLTQSEFTILRDIVEREIRRQHTSGSRVIAAHPDLAELAKRFLRDVESIERKLRAAMTTNCVRIE